MGLCSPVEPECSRTQVGEFARVDACAHETASRVRVRLKQVVPNFVGNGAPKHDAESMVLQRGRRQQLSHWLSSTIRLAPIVDAMATGLKPSDATTLRPSTPRAPTSRLAVP